MRPLTNNLNQRGVWWLQLGMSLPSHGSPILSSTSLRVAVLQVPLQPHLSRLGIPSQILLRRQCSVSSFMQSQLRSLRKRKVGCLSDLCLFTNLFVLSMVCLNLFRLCCGSTIA